MGLVKNRSQIVWPLDLTLDLDFGLTISKLDGVVKVAIKGSWIRDPETFSKT